jgi:multidrug resistance efflux pump
VVCEDLFVQQLVSQQALEILRTQVETLQAQLATQSRQVELAQASVRGAELQLDYATLRALFWGFIAKADQAGLDGGRAQARAVTPGRPTVA